MSAVEVARLTKRYGAQAVVDGIDLLVPDGEFVTLLGPSGCGKTTTLRCIAGLEKPDAGRISIAAELVTDGERGHFVPPNRRRLGMVFQSYALWPHMTVFGNVAYALKLQEAGVRTILRRHPGYVHGFTHVLIFGPGPREAIASLAAAASSAPRNGRMIGMTFMTTPP